MFNRISSLACSRASLLCFSGVTAFGAYQLGYYEGLTSPSSGILLHERKVSSSPDKEKPILTTAGLVYVPTLDKYVLIERGKAPEGLAFFGGHVEAQESPEQAFKREAQEELNVAVSHLVLFGVYGNWGRDPRQHSVEANYFAQAMGVPKAGSDAKAVRFYSKDELRALVNNPDQKFAFDHRKILLEWLTKNP